MDLGIKGRKAIVCGSSRGLGRAIAGSLARAGCTVVLNGIDAERLTREAEALSRETGAAVLPVAADVTTWSHPPPGRLCFGKFVLFIIRDTLPAALAPSPAPGRATATITTTAAPTASAPHPGPPRRCVDVGIPVVHGLQFVNLRLIPSTG